jgi:hypothetical protein
VHVLPATVSLVKPNLSKPNLEPHLKVFAFDWECMLPHHKRLCLGVDALHCHLPHSPQEPADHDTCAILAR